MTVQSRHQADMERWKHLEAANDPGKWQYLSFQRLVCRAGLNLWLPGIASVQCFKVFQYVGEFEELQIIQGGQNALQIPQKTSKNHQIPTISYDH